MPGSELVDVVDKCDRVLETRTLDECLKQGLLHRAVTVFLRNSNGEIFLQQRSKEDDWLPGMWTASCTGHVKSGENAAAAAVRELNEELGVACSPTFLFKFLVPAIRYQDKTERELDIVFQAASDGTIQLDTKEVEQGMFLTVEQCKGFFKNNSNEITLDAWLAFEKYSSMKHLE